MRTNYIAVIVLVCMLGGGSVFAALGYTDVAPPPLGGADHASILADIYGGIFTADGVDFVGSDGINAYRVYDFDDQIDSTLNMLTGDQTDVDQIWTDGIAMVAAEGMWSPMGMIQSFGWNEGGTDTGNYFEFFDAVGEEALVPVEGDFLWCYSPDTDAWWSLMSANDDNLDHIVTYKIEGADLYGETMWLMFMEASLDTQENWDFNDFVVEVSVVIPEPASMLLFGIGALVLLRKRK